MTKKELTIDDVNKALKKFAENEDLDAKNPYLKEDGKIFDKIVGEFCESLNSKNSNEGFYWLEKFGVISEGEKYKPNVNYGMPTHVHGDYKNGLIYLCLLNPGMQINDKEKFDNIKSYYEALSKKVEKGLTKEYGESDYYFYEQMDLEIKDNYRNLDKEMVKEYIYDEKTSILTKELLKIKYYLQENEFDKTWKKLKKKDDLTRNIYYIWHYFKKLLKESTYLNYNNLPDDYKLYGESKDKARGVTTNKVVNIELCPFRSKNANAVKKLSRTDYGKFSAYIIWYRIGQYLNDLEKDNNTEKPIFIFRSYCNKTSPDWKDILVDTLYEINKEEIDSEIIKEYIKVFEREYFYIFNSQNGMISKGNLSYFDKNNEKKKISSKQFDELRELVKQ
ncbi:hypothetical protein I6H45_08270 [Anaerococcus vaginalis]|uniref:Uncharacterized protein n=2 Tax=Anaerococcus vaginalis TaxID=33037 RepID=C7HW49_9FIRM|nr:hypothetical protein [Anaerococcus vaginalis]EEU12151.1 hypothetical protein HMPREF0078_1447 [Anaerococcus vaginalis ATCC 51170]QQB61783.1 hypothetical protein I6H45_08270 [Anaerococcus vaginalis]